MKALILFLFISLSLNGNAQSKKIKWQDVQVLELSRHFTKEDVDSIGLCMSEWFVKGEAGALSELSPSEITSIKKDAARYHCNIVYVDVKKFYGVTKGRLIVFGYKK